MKYLIIFMIMSIAGTASVISSSVQEFVEPTKSIPVEYIDFEKSPIYITAYV
jgi:hypothetical protein